jgi:hypothetical protein
MQAVNPNTFYPLPMYPFPFQTSSLQKEEHEETQSLLHTIKQLSKQVRRPDYSCSHSYIYLGSPSHFQSGRGTLDIAIFGLIMTIFSSVSLLFSSLRYGRTYQQMTQFNRQVGLFNQKVRARKYEEEYSQKVQLTIDKARTIFGRLQEKQKSDIRYGIVMLLSGAALFTGAVAASPAIIAAASFTAIAATIVKLFKAIFSSVNLLNRQDAQEIKEKIKVLDRDFESPFKPKKCFAKPLEIYQIPQQTTPFVQQPFMQPSNVEPQNGMPHSFVPPFDIKSVYPSP